MMSELCLSGSQKFFLLDVIGVSWEGLSFGCCSKEEKGDAKQAEIQRMEGLGLQKGGPYAW